MHFHSLRQREEGDILVRPSPAAPKRWQALDTARRYFYTPEMVFQLLALFSFFSLPKYSKLTVLVLFSRCLQCFSLQMLCTALVAAVWGGTFVSSLGSSSHCGTNSLRIIKQNLPSWKGTRCRSPRLPASSTRCTSWFWLLSFSPDHFRTRRSLRMHIMGSLGLEIRCQNSRWSLGT